MPKITDWSLLDIRKEFQPDELPKLWFGYDPNFSDDIPSIVWQKVRQIKKLMQEEGFFYDSTNFGGYRSLPYIPREKLHDFANKHKLKTPLLHDEDREIPEESAAEYLNKENPHYSSELAAANLAWQHFNTRKGQWTKENVQKWLTEKYRDKFSIAALKRIASIIMPDSKKGGGAPRTE